MNNDNQSIEEKNFERLRVVITKATGIIIPPFGKKAVKPIVKFLKDITEESIGTGKALVVSHSNDDLVRAASKVKDAEPLRKAIQDIMNGFHRKPISVISKELSHLNTLINPN